MKKFLDTLNSEPYIVGEGYKFFDIGAAENVVSIMSKHKNLGHLLNHSSLKDKMIISYFLYTGKYGEISDTFMSSLDDCIKRGLDVDCVLRNYVGIDTRGLLTFALVVGKYLDIFALEERIDNSFKNWLDKDTQGSSWKAGRVFQYLIKNSFRKTLQIGS